MLYTAKGRLDPQTVTFSGATFTVPAPGRVSLLHPTGLDGQLDVFARELA